MIEEDIPDIVETLRECAEDSRKVEGDYYADQFATDASVFDDAADAIERLRLELSDAGKSNHPENPDSSTLTDEEREAVRYMIAAGKFGQRDEALTEEHAATLRGLLERTK